MINASPMSFATPVPKPRNPTGPIPTHGFPTAAPKLVLYENPTPASIYEDALLWTFLNYFTQKTANRAWGAKLPQLRSAKNAAAMQSAAKAVSLAFAAKNLNNMSMAAAACEYYGESLHHHQRSFVSSNECAICWRKAVNALPVTVLLSYFEMIQPTSADAWLRHTAAAERLFLRVGPNALKDDLLNHLYFVIKSNSVIRCFLSGTRTQLFDQAWSDIRMNHLSGPSSILYNKIVDLVAHLSNKFALNPAAASSSESPHEQAILIQGHLTELSELWFSFGSLVQLNTDGLPWITAGPDAAVFHDISVPPSEHALPPMPTQIQEPDTALTAATLHAASIMVLTLLQRSEADAWSYSDLSPSITYHATQILACAKHLTVYGVGCSCLYMMLPITTVHRLSPHPRQRQIAKTIFQHWSSASGLAGLAGLAFGGNTSDAAAMSFMTPARDFLQHANLGEATAWELDTTLRDSRDFLANPDEMRWIQQQ